MREWIFFIEYWWPILWGVAVLALLIMSWALPGRDRREESEKKEEGEIK